MKCEWLKNESSYFVTFKYLWLILQRLHFRLLQMRNSPKRLQDQPKLLTNYEYIYGIH